MKAQFQFSAREVSDMAPTDIEDMIPPKIMTRLKESDPRPRVKVFSVGHEGVARGAILGAGVRALRYTKDAVHSLFGALREGTSVFLGHGVTNSHAGREPIGEIVGKALRVIGGRLHTIAAVYLRPEHRDAKLDVASFEGNVEFNDAGDGYEATGIVDITGLALGNSETTTPGFDGARLITEAAFFVPFDDDVDFSDPRLNPHIPRESDSVFYAHGDMSDPAQNSLIPR